MRGLLKTKEMKVIKDFYCIKTKKSYKVGDKYEGERTDINHLLDIKEIEVIDAKVVKAKNKK